MSLIVVRKLKPKWRQVENADGTYDNVMMSAFIGAKTEMLTEFGIGLIGPNNNLIFRGLVTPHRLILAWRAMWLLDYVKRIKTDTLATVYELMRDDPAVSSRYSESLRGQVEDLEALRLGLLEAKISDAELESMLVICNDSRNDINLSVEELEEALTDRIISPIVELEYTFRLRATDKARELKIDEIVKRPLPGKQSLRRFCEKFGIERLCRCPSGSYGVDWDYYSMNRIDEELMRAGLLHNAAIDLYCPTQKRKGSRDFGHIGHPVFKSADGRSVAVKQAKYNEVKGTLVYIEPVLTGELGEWIVLGRARELLTKMVGVTYGEYAQVKDSDLRRGYIGVQPNNTSCKPRSKKW